MSFGVDVGQGGILGEESLPTVLSVLLLDSGEFSLEDSLLSPHLFLLIVEWLQGL